MPTRGRSWSSASTFDIVCRLLLIAGLLNVDQLESPLLEPEDAHYAEVPRHIADEIKAKSSGKPFRG